MKRTILGGLLLLIFVGEVTVGAASGLYTPGGVIVFLILYCLYFLLLDSLLTRYRLSNLGIVLINFALYSVFFTGLIHGEVADYILEPQNSLGITLIRIQCSLYPIFAFYLLHKIAPARRSALPVWKSGLFFLLFLLLLTPTKEIGFIKMVETFHIAPVHATVFMLAALIAIIIGIRLRSTHPPFRSRMFMFWTLLLLVIACVPGIVSFFFLLIPIMIIVSVVYLLHVRFRRASVLAL